MDSGEIEDTRLDHTKVEKLDGDDKAEKVKLLRGEKVVMSDC